MLQVPEIENETRLFLAKVLVVLMGYLSLMN